MIKQSSPSNVWIRSTPDIGKGKCKDLRTAMGTSVLSEHRTKERGQGNDAFSLFKIFI